MYQNVSVERAIADRNKTIWDWIPRIQKVIRPGSGQHQMGQFTVWADMKGRVWMRISKYPHDLPWPVLDEDLSELRVEGGLT
jgi:hypothetical protein